MFKVISEGNGSFFLENDLPAIYHVLHSLLRTRFYNFQGIAEPFLCNWYSITPRFIHELRELHEQIQYNFFKYALQITFRIFDKP